LVQKFAPAVAEPIFALGALVPAYIPYRPWTLITYMFLHASFGHIFFNMLSLYIFGPRLEIQLSAPRFLGLYVVSGIAGGLLSWIFTPYVPIVGASGAILGVMFGYAKYWPRDQIYLWFVPMQVRVAVIVMTALDRSAVSAAKRGTHAGRQRRALRASGGFVGAFAFLRILDLRPRQRQFQAQLRSSIVSRTDLDRWSKIPRDQLHEVNREELDRIMQKIETEGVASVTPQERTFLDNFSERTSS
jgi:membrane associated rhomboid family serine protease